MKCYGKNGENNKKAGNIAGAISQAPTFGPEHDKIRAHWASNIVLGAY
jgi:hypothetical protein